jgi:hypothetical protein
MIDAMTDHLDRPEGTVNLAAGRLADREQGG